MNVIQIKDKYIEMKDAIKVMTSLIDNENLVIEDKFLKYENCYEFKLRINYYTNIKVSFDIENNQIRIISNITTKSDRKKFLIEELKKICAEPKYINHYYYWAGSKYIYKLVHCFKMTKNNVERMYNIFNLELELILKE